MKRAIFSFLDGERRDHPGNDVLDEANVNLVIGLGDKAVLADTAFYAKLHQDYPNAEIVLCSTAGEIFDDTVQESTVSITAVQFEKSLARSAMVDINHFNGCSYEAGKTLIQNLTHFDDLSYILVFSDGSQVNGSELVNGINS